MDLSYSDEDKAFQADIRQWLKDRLPQELSDKVRSGKRLQKEDFLAWHQMLRERGFLAQMWPVEYGGTGWTAAEKAIFDEECIAAAAPRVVPFGLNMLVVPLFHLSVTDWKWLLTGFALFRFFDMLKPWPISWLDNHVHGGFGIMLDDIVAGVMAFVSLYLVGRLAGWV